jgi:hypothetical protein
MNYPKSLTRFLSLIFIVAIVSCSGGKKGDGKKYDLSFSSLKGPSFTNSANTNVKVETSVMGITINMDMKIGTDLRFDVLPDTAGLKRLKMTYEKINMTMDVPAMGQLKNLT